MARRAFYSFHYKPDSARASQIRNMGIIEGNKPVTDNDWEKVRGGGDQAIESWIDAQLEGRSCTIVLIGENTAGRKFINYEIVASWNKGMGVLGIYIHNLKDLNEKQSQMGGNPFDHVTLKSNGKKLSEIVPIYNPPHSDSKAVYAYIQKNLAAWIEKAIAIRAEY